MPESGVETSSIASAPSVVPEVGKQEVRQSVYADSGASGVSGVAEVPQGPPALVGRHQEFDRLLRSLAPQQPDEPEVLSTSPPDTAVVAGMGGIGKTALVLNAAVAAHGRGWFSRVVWLDLQSHTPGVEPLSDDQALDTALRQLNVPASDIPPTTEEKAAAYRGRLAGEQQRRGAPVLVVADNAGSVEQVEALRPGHGGSRLVVITRQWLQLPAVHRHAVNILDSQSATRLLEHQLREADPQDSRSADYDGLRQLASACEGLPLALTIMGAVLVRDPGHEPAELAAELRELEDSAERLGRFDDGHRGLEGVFATSLDRLADAQRMMFVLLGLSPGRRSSTTAVVLLAGTQEHEVRPVLLDLARAHLVQHRAARDQASGEEFWELHDLVADYARSLAEEARQNDTEADQTYHAAQIRLIDHYTAMTEAADRHLHAQPGDDVSAAFGDREEALAWLDDHREALVTAVRTAVEIDHTKAACDLPLLLNRYLDSRRDFADNLDLNAVAHRLFTQADDLQGQATALYNLGNALLHLRRFEQAVSLHTTALELFTKLGHQHVAARTWNQIATALRALRRFEQAVSAHTAALELLEDLHDSAGQANALDNLGITEQDLRRFASAITSHTLALDLLRELGDRHAEAGAWTNLGTALQGRRRYADAVEAHTRARDLWRELGDRHAEATAWTNLGTALEERRRYRDSLAALTWAQHLFHETDDRHGEALTCTNLGNTLVRLRRFDEAVAMHTRARDLFRHVGDHHGEARAWINLGAALYSMGRIEEALTAAEQGLDGLEAAGDEHYARRVRGILAGYKIRLAVRWHVWDRWRR
ncbi:tetratricopeptide (TPR) repeat protein [Lipingzhangella halophila]|uniref:Tetratricopeptide (TPR) repeat protein n=1 Tax=Lipingzhangella halophila TaxID=1783352 RepID=A0A7W7RLV7_9ACTN|nr:tetratricopeptide repeat protein [Lipingzhangella halophila]MBB4934384.1 tetratricopeptide (TPR) repeat protein [Lipingzhangella halophila]